MSTTLTGEPRPKANGKGTHSKSRRVGDTVVQPISDWGHPQAVFDYKDARGNLLYQNVSFPLVTADGSPVLSSGGKPDKTFRLRRPNGKGGWVDGALSPARPGQGARGRCDRIHPRGRSQG